MQTKKIWTITLVDDVFVLTGPEGKVISGKCPKRLSSLAFDYGADEVRHSYPLEKDPGYKY